MRENAVRCKSFLYIFMSAGTLSVNRNEIYLQFTKRIRLKKRCNFLSVDSGRRFAKEYFGIYNFADILKQAYL